MDAPPKRKSKNQPQPQEVRLPDGTKVVFPAPPKKPLSPYMAFQMEKRQDLLAKEPNLQFTAIGSKLGECWQKLTQEEKKGYTLRYREEYDGYRKRREAYEKEVSDLMRKHNISEAQLKAASGHAVPQNNSNNSNRPNIINLSNHTNWKSPFQLFRDKMVRQFDTMNIAVGDFDKIVQNMWDGFLPQEKMLYVNLAKRLYENKSQVSQQQKRPQASSSSSSRASWPPSSGYSMAAPQSRSVQSPPSGMERYHAIMNTQRSPSVPVSPFAVYQEEMKHQIHDLNLQMANFQQTTQELWNSFSKKDKAVYFRIYNERLALARCQQTQKASPKDRTKERQSESPSIHTAGSAGYYGNKRTYSDVGTTSLDSLIICPGDNMNEQQKNSLKRIKVPMFNFEVADVLGNGVGQVLEFTWKQEPLNSYLTHHGPYEQEKIPESFCVYKDTDANEDFEMNLQTELPEELGGTVENEDENLNTNAEECEKHQGNKDSNKVTSTIQDSVDTDLKDSENNNNLKDSRIGNQNLKHSTNNENDITRNEAELDTPASAETLETLETPGGESDQLELTSEVTSLDPQKFINSNPVMLDILTKPTETFIDLDSEDDDNNSEMELQTTLSDMEDEETNDTDRNTDIGLNTDEKDTDRQTSESQVSESTKANTEQKSNTEQHIAEPIVVLPDNSSNMNVDSTDSLSQGRIQES